MHKPIVGPFLMLVSESLIYFLTEIGFCVTYMTFVWISFGLLTKMAPSLMKIRAGWFKNVGSPWPSAKTFVYSGSSTIWNNMSCAKSVMLAVMLGLPACRKA